MNRTVTPVDPGPCQNPATQGSCRGTATMCEGRTPGTVIHDSEDPR